MGITQERVRRIVPAAINRKTIHEPASPLRSERRDDATRRERRRRLAGSGHPRYVSGAAGKRPTAAGGDGIVGRVARREGVHSASRADQGAELVAAGPAFRRPRPPHSEDGALHLYPRGGPAGAGWLRQAGPALS
jgi:hypothetical protein